MTPEEAMREVVWRLGTQEEGATNVALPALQWWHPELTSELLRLSLLVEDSPAASVLCPACEDEHYEAVQVSGDLLHLFVPCSTYGRVEIELDDRRQWRR